MKILLTIVLLLFINHFQQICSNPIILYESTTTTPIQQSSLLEQQQSSSSSSSAVCNVTSTLVSGIVSTATTETTASLLAKTIGKQPEQEQREQQQLQSTSTGATMSEVVLKPVVICGPSGVGKGTLIEMLMKHYPDNKFGFSVSHTTRQPRSGEIDGVHYNFTTVDAIKADIANGKFIEYAEVHGKYYGTSVAAVESVQQSGKICILDIDVQGVQKVKQSTLEPYYIFIAPPSFEELEKRLRGRATETEDAIQIRLQNAASELEYGNAPGNFDRVFVNSNLQDCFDSIVEQMKQWYPQLN